MLPLQLVLRPERDDSAWPSPPRARAIKRRNSGSSIIRRANPRSSRPSLVLYPVQHSFRSPPTPKTFSRRRSRHLAIHHDTWRSVMGLPQVCGDIFKTVVSTVTSIAQTVFHTASTMVLWWWNGYQEDESSTLEIFERQPKERCLDDIVKENNRLKRLLEFAVASHVIMNEATSMLEDGADLWMQQTEDVVDAKIQEAEAERDALALQLQELQEQLGDKDQEMERLRDGFVWATENLNGKEDEICELHEQVEHYEVLLKELNAKVV